MQTADVDAVVYPDIILPAQHAAMRRDTPERRLMIAVLDDAIHAVLKYRSATDGLRRRLVAEEIDWLLSEDTRWPYSFECICDTLDLDAGAIRSGLRLTANPPADRDGDAAFTEPRLRDTGLDRDVVDAR